MKLLAGNLTGTLMGSSAAAVGRVHSSRGIHLRALLCICGTVLFGAAVWILFPGIWAQVQDEFLVWSVAGAIGVIGLATVANVLELALDLETS